MRYAIGGLLCGIGVVLGALFISRHALLSEDRQSVDVSYTIAVSPTPTVAATHTPSMVPPPSSYEIPRKLHVYQTFNNCGPATLSMALSYLDVEIGQEDLGDILRPYQVPGGNNDDKSVTLAEVAAQAEEYGFVSTLRPNGTVDTIKKLIAQDIVVVARTWLAVDEDIGHYRVIRGYDDATGVIIQDDSLQGRDLRFSYDKFRSLWRPFNYEYLVIVPLHRQDIVDEILGEEIEEHTAWENARLRIEEELSNDPQNRHLLFALSRIHYYLGRYAESVSYFNTVEPLLSPRTLWYQIEPLHALYEVGEHDRLLDTTSYILSHDNRAFTELYLIRGKIYENRGETDLAEQEYEKAVYYNVNKEEVRDALERVRGEVHLDSI